MQFFLLELAYTKCIKECIHECMNFVRGIVPNDDKILIDTFGFDQFGKGSIVWECTEHVLYLGLFIVGESPFFYLVDSYI